MNTLSREQIRKMTLNQLRKAATEAGFDTQTVKECGKEELVQALFNKYAPRVRPEFKGF